MKRIHCCIALRKAIEEDTTFEERETPPFSRERIPPGVWILDDGGHGGAYKINYCPFCGKWVQFDKGPSAVDRIKPLGEE